MKIKPEDLAALRAAVEPLDTTTLRVRYLAGDFPRADRVQDLDRRYRWDLLAAFGIKLGDGVGIKGDLDLYAYMNDEHIDTVLRHAVPAFGIRRQELSRIKNALGDIDTPERTKSSCTEREMGYSPPRPRIGLVGRRCSMTL